MEVWSTEIGIFRFPLFSVYCTLRRLMKNNRNVLLMLIAAGFLVAFSGCKKNDGGDDSPADMGASDEAAAVVGAPATIRLVHAAAAGAVDVYVDDSLVASNLRRNAFERSRLTLNPGAHSVELKAAGTDGRAISSFSLDIAPGTDYTAVVVGTAANIEVITTGDDLTASNGGTVRFIHAIPGANNIDIKTGDGTLVADDVDYKDVSNYVTLPAGDMRISILSGSNVLHSGPVPVNESRALTTVIAPTSDGVTYINVAERTR